MIINGLKKHKIPGDEAAMLDPGSADPHPLVKPPYISWASGVATSLLATAPDTYPAWAVLSGRETTLTGRSETVMALTAIIGSLWSWDHLYALRKRSFSPSPEDLDFLKGIHIAPLTSLDKAVILEIARDIPLPRPHHLTPHLGVIAMGEIYPEIAAIDAAARTYTQYTLSAPSSDSLHRI